MHCPMVIMVVDQVWQSCRLRVSERNYVTGQSDSHLIKGSRRQGDVAQLDIITIADNTAMCSGST